MPKLSLGMSGVRGSKQGRGSAFGGRRAAPIAFLGVVLRKILPYFVLDPLHLNVFINKMIIRAPFHLGTWPTKPNPDEHP